MSDYLCGVSGTCDSAVRSEYVRLDMRGLCQDCTGKIRLCDLTVPFCTCVSCFEIVFTSDLD